MIELEKEVKRFPATFAEAVQCDGGLSLVASPGDAAYGCFGSREASRSRDLLKGAVLYGLTFFGAYSSALRSAP